MSTRTLFKFDTKLSADTVEWCPDAHYRNTVACGTYQLDAETGKRHGSLSLHKIAHTRTTTEERYSTATLQDIVLDYGVLDMKWADQSVGTVLALAASCGDVVFVRLTTKDTGEEGVCVFEELGKVALSSLDEKSALSLSVDWNRHRIASSDSLGRLSVVSCENRGGGGFRLLQTWQAHSFEAWIVCFGREADIIYSGGDDSKLCVWDTRTPPDRPVATCREHTMGVCSLQLHPFQEHLLASGSYDEHVRVWDVRSLKRSVKEVTLGGGVWRIKWHHTNHDVMATACMHSGFKIIAWHLESDVAEAEVVCHYGQHESLAYGIDWSRGQTGHSTHMLASCSFYDHSLQLWTTTL